MESAALYLRVSSDEQAGEGHVSLEVQRLRCEEYAQRHGWVLAETYTEAESAFSASERPVFEKMLCAAKAGRFQHLVVFNASRFSRRASETLAVFEVLKAAGVTVHSTLEDLTNWLMLGFQAIINESESRRISERVKPAFQHMAEQGLWPRANIRPFGFQFLSDPSGKRKQLAHPDRVLQPDPVEAPVVRNLFRRYAEGESLRQLAVWLHARGYKGGVSVTPVHKLLRNPLYAGRIHWNGKTYPGKHEPIVDPALFDVVQERMAGRYQHQQPAIVDYAVAGLLTCGTCGKRLGIHRRQRMSSTAFRCVDTSCTPRSHVPAAQAEAAVRRAVAQLHAEPEALDAMIAEASRLYSTTTADYAKQRRTLDQARKTAQDRLDRLTEFLLDGTLTREQYLQQQPRLDGAARAAERELAALVEPVAFDPAPLRAAVAALPAIIETAAAPAVHEAFRLFIDHVECNVPAGRVPWRDEYLRVVWRV